jgi:hypothetical protein
METRKVGDIIRNDFAKEAGNRNEAFQLYYTFTFREYLLLYSLASGYRFISGHVLFSEHAYRHFRQDGYNFMTIVRDPVQRFISQYKFSLREKHNLDEYLELPDARQQGSVLVRYFSGLPRSTEWTENSLLVTALENIDKFDLIAILEHLEQFREEFNKRFRIKLTIPHANKGQTPPIKITSEQQAKIVKLCEPDTMLYQDILKRIFGKNVAKTSVFKN